MGNKNGIKDWEEVNLCLKEFGECKITIESIEAEMNIKINDVKLEADKLSKPLKENIKKLEKQIEDFVDEHKFDIDGKTKELTFGKIGFRQVSKISIPNKKIEKIISNLKKFGMEQCIKITETINKDVLSTYSDKDIAKIGASRKVEDKFWCEPNYEKIRG